MYHNYSSARYQYFLNLVKTLIKWLSIGNNEFISVFPDEANIFDWVFSKECSFVFQKKKKKVLTSSPIQRMEVIHWKTNGIKTGWKCIASNLEELFSLGSIKGKQKQTDDISGAFYCIVQEN